MTRSFSYLGACWKCRISSPPDLLNHCLHFVWFMQQKSLSSTVLGGTSLSNIGRVGVKKQAYGWQEYPVCRFCESYSLFSLLFHLPLAVKKEVNKKEELELIYYNIDYWSPAFFWNCNKNWQLFIEIEFRSCSHYQEDTGWIFLLNCQLAIY